MSKDNRPIKNKWYICEGYKILNHPPSSEEIDESSKHNKAISEMIIAGPFEDEAQANEELKTKNYESYYSPFVWQYT